MSAGAPVSGARTPTVVALQVVLGALGALMVLASRVSARFRRQVTRSVTILVATDDGVSQAFRFHARSRTMTLARTCDGTPDGALRFDTARRGLVSLLSPRAIGRIVEGMNDGTVRIDGNALLAVWFHGLTRVVFPIGRSRLPRTPIPVPPPAQTMRQDTGWAARIVREPPVDVLPTASAAAWRARAKTLQIRAASGEPLPPG